MSKTSAAEIYAAIQAAAQDGLLGGPAFGADPPGLRAGVAVYPPHCNAVTNTSTVTVTAGRYYIAPFWFNGRTTFSGALFHQGGTGDSGKKVKIAFFYPTAAGPIGALAKSFGEYTLDGSATTKQMASSWRPPRGWYWGEFVCDGGGVFNGMRSEAYVSGVGGGSVNPLAQLLGAIVANALLAENTRNQYIGDYVAGTYANFPEATSLAPTASISASTAASFPAFGLYT